MSANTETCANTDKSECGYNEFRRLKYFHGMLLDEKDFRAEQQYHTGKRRFLNRMLHGSGVVCGLELKGEKGKRWIKITSGLALDCSGNEIWVDKDLRIDLASLLPPKAKGTGKEGCRQEDEGDGLRTYYIGICYEEKPTNPVSVYLPSGGCEERTCENSQWKEGFCVQLVECCVDKLDPGVLVEYCKCKGTPFSTDKFKDPCGKCGKNPDESDATKGTAQKTAEQTPAGVAWCQCMVLENFCESSVPCGECCSCEQPCFVILGQIKVDKDKYVLEKLCMNECRRYVLTGRLVQQILVRLLSGASAFFDMKVGDQKVPLPNNLEEYIYNPIKALCWWLPYKLQGGQFEWLNCEKKQPAQTLDPEALLVEAKMAVAKSEAVLLQVSELQTTNKALVQQLQQFEIPKVVKGATLVKPADAESTTTEKPAVAEIATEAKPAVTEKATEEKPKVAESEQPADKQSPKPKKG